MLSTDLLPLILLAVMALSLLVVAASLLSTAYGIWRFQRELRASLLPVLAETTEILATVSTMVERARTEADTAGEAVESLSERIEEAATLLDVLLKRVERPLLLSVAGLLGWRRLWKYLR